MLSIRSNIASFDAQRNMSGTSNALQKSMERLSSGFRINRAADDAAGLSISEGLRAQTGGLKVAVRNAQDGVSVVQTAEGALTETQSILRRMRDLAVQGSNDGGLDTNAKSNIQSEMTQLNSELDRIAVPDAAYREAGANVATVLENLAAVLRKTNRTAEAEGMEARARTIKAKHAQTVPAK